MRATYLATAVFMAALGAQSASIDWLTDLDAGLARAKQQAKPLFLVFRCEP